MTKQIEIVNDKRYIPVHNEGFVGLSNCMGSDQLVEKVARTSYAKGTRKTSDTKNLLRYLIRNRHTSPLEIGGIMVFHVKLPIFCARQIIRHRTFSYNEISLRYSEAEDSFYIPSSEYIQYQSKSNKQGRDGQTEEYVTYEYISDIEFESNRSYSKYKKDLDKGIAREICRNRLPVNLYTEWYMKCDLHNLMHFLKLRMDRHAQIETRDYANAMYNIAKQEFPICMEAFDDYILNSTYFSKNEMILLKDYILDKNILLQDNLQEKYLLSKREIDEFKQKILNHGL